MGGVGIDPQPRIGQVVGEELRVDGRDHHVVVAVGDERGMCDPGKPVELGRVWDAPFDDRVVLSACDLRTIWLAAPSSRLKARCTYSWPSPAGLGDLEEDLKQLLDAAVRVVRRALNVEDPAVHLLASAGAGPRKDDASYVAWSQQSELLRNAAQRVSKQVDPADLQCVTERSLTDARTL
jgi:hypothetical protein